MRPVRLFASLSLITGMVLLSAAVHADECGAPPVNQPVIDDTAITTTDDLRAIRDAVIAYSNTVDEWLGCMDRRMAKINPYLTKEQRNRWQQDSADMHNGRRDLQVKLNEVIRAFRNSQQDG